MNTVPDSGPAIEYAFLPLKVATTSSRYVALGDSYSSGEGAINGNGDAAFDLSTNTSTNKCHRSAYAYANAVRTARNFDLPDFRFAACSGAVIADFVAKEPAAGQWNEGPQLDAIAAPGAARSATRLVTLSLGGNDAGFPQVLPKCVLGPYLFFNSEAGCRTTADTYSAKGFSLLSAGGFIQLDQTYNTWNYCTGACRSGPQPPPASGAQNLTVPSLSGLYREIHRRAPQARIDVMLYPHLFPQTPPAKCAVGTFVAAGGARYTYYLTKSEMTYLNQIGQHLNEVITQQVSIAHQAGITIRSVDPNSADGPHHGFTGHELCGTSTPWLNGIMWGSNLLDISPFSFHPNALGQAYFASVVDS